MSEKQSVKVRVSDNESRDWITKTKINENLFVNAGAGSGKTTSLVKRMLAMVKGSPEVGKPGESGYIPARDPIPVEQIAAITFTKAAATEFFSRFQKALADDGSDSCQNALAKIDLCFMGTIDAFCNTLVTEHPALASLPSGSKVVSNEECDKLYLRYYTKAIKEGGKLVSSTFKKELKWFLAVNRNPEEVYLATIKKLRDTQFADFGQAEWESTPGWAKWTAFFKTERFSCEELELLKKLPKFFELVANNDELRWCGGPGAAAAWEEIDKCSDVVISYGSTEDFQELLTHFPSALNLFKKLATPKYVRLSINDAQSLLGEAYLKELGFVEGKGQKRGEVFYQIAEKQSDFAKILAALKRYQFWATVTFCSHMLSYVKGELTKEGKLTFSDYLRAVRDMLRSDASSGGKLIAHVQARHKYYLLDEFQDTAPVQMEIFNYLTILDPLKNLPLKEGQTIATAPKVPGSLFIVGDPKQSIYRFRGADISSYRAVETNFCDPRIGSVAPLANNFRSVDALKVWFNKTFANGEYLGTEANGYEDGLGFAGSEIENVPEDGHCVEDDPAEKEKKESAKQLKPSVSGTIDGVYRIQALSHTDSATPDLPDKKPAEVVAEIVEDFVSPRGSEKSCAFSKPVQYRDIMVITSAKAELSDIMAELDSRPTGARIPFEVAGRVNFSGCPALTMVYRILSVCCQKEGNPDILELPNSPEFNETLNKYSREIVRLNPSDAFERVITLFNVLEMADNKGLDYLYYALELLKAQEQSNSGFTFVNGLEYIGELLSGGLADTVERYSPIKRGGNRVLLANLHKVKGLERPVVILTPKRAKDGGGQPESHIDANGHLHLFRVKGGAFATTSLVENPDVQVPDEKEDSEYAYLQKIEDAYLKKEVNESKEETLRLEYVAATRAKNALLIGEIRNRTKTKGDTFSSKWKRLLNSKAGVQDYSVLRDSQLSKDGPGARYTVSCAQAEEIKHAESGAKQTSEPRQTQVDLGQGQLATYRLEQPSKIHGEDKLISEYDETSDQGEVPFLREVALTTAENSRESAPHATPAHSQLGVSPALWGTMVHSLMEKLVLRRVWNRSALADDTSLSLLAKSVASSFVPALDAASLSNCQTLLEGVAQKMLNGGFDQTSAQNSDLFDTLAKAQEIFTEVPFYVSGQENTITNGVMDLVYHDEAGWHIVDYKTNSSGEGLLAKYADQLSSYKRALEEFVGAENPISTSIYHISACG